ncbi:hypothetical protein DFP72DRAFT_1085851 [Ephemerocybe angulata]|uniref:Uncharacterized protein n=1 Tax=Ephemerocybe angulata TaxID=980116 RepID=A0A8H6H7S2_9AGAR|nr:hypothetical protein DFP72DRAFT_1085851 [Tulosesus angulatus]
MAPGVFKCKHFTCDHKCHSPTQGHGSRSRELIPSQNIGIVSYTGHTWEMHCKKYHTACQCGGIEPLRHNTTAREWMKYAGRMYLSKQGDTQRNQVLESYREAWKEVYKGPPLIYDGGPWDLSQDERFRVASVTWARIEPPALEQPHPRAPPPQELDWRDECPAVAHLSESPPPGIKLVGPAPELSGILPAWPETEKDRPIQTLFVLCPPWRFYSEEKMEANTIVDDLDEGDFLKALRDALVGSGESERDWIRQEGIGHRAYAWLQLCLHLKNAPQKWSVSIWNWRRFSEATLTVESRDFQTLKQLDLVVGGCHWTGDFLASTGTRMTVTQLWTHLCVLKDLSSTVAMWPDPMEHLEAGRKVRLQDTINVSSMALRLPMFKTWAVGSLEQVATQSLTPIGRRCVFKREYSAGAKHVFLPEELGGPRREAKLKEAQQLEKKWAERGNFPEPLWIAQPYIKELKEKGELRAFFVRGALAYVVHSIDLGDGQLSYSLVTRFQKLDTLSETKPWWVQSEMDKDMQDHSFQLYALSMLQMIISLEESASGTQSGLRLFARLDISAFREGEGYRYFVNEITRSHATALFHSDVRKDDVDYFWDNFVIGLEAWTRGKLKGR